VHPHALEAHIPTNNNGLAPIARHHAVHALMQAIAQHARRTSTSIQILVLAHAPLECMGPKEYANLVPPDAQSAPVPQHALHVALSMEKLMSYKVRLAKPPATLLIIMLTVFVKLVMLLAPLVSEVQLLNAVIA
jgi:hypothetical protein